MIKNWEGNHLVSVSLVACVEPAGSRNPCLWMNRIEAAHHATPSSVESGGVKDLCGGK